MLYLTCAIISSVDLTHYGVSHAKDMVFGTASMKKKYTLTSEHRG